ELHRFDRILIFRGDDTPALMRVPSLQTDAQTFLVVQRCLHTSSLASTWRDRNLSARPLVDPEIQRPHATGRIDRCGSVGARGKETRVVFRHRERLLRLAPDMLAHPKRADRS